MVNCTRCRCDYKVAIHLLQKLPSISLLTIVSRPFVYCNQGEYRTGVEARSFVGNKVFYCVQIALFTMLFVILEAIRRVFRPKIRSNSHNGNRSSFESQFSYCPLLWVFCSRKLNNEINRLHERALRVAYSDYVSSFEELLIKDGTCTIH